MNDRVEMNVPYFQIPNEIFEIGLSTQEIAVYVYLARCSNQGSKAFPSYNTIASKTGMSKSSALRTVEKLISKKLIRKIKRKKPDGVENYSNIYIVEHDLRGSVTQTPPSTTQTPPSVTVTPYKEPPKQELIKKINIHRHADDYIQNYLDLFQSKYKRSHYKVTQSQLDYIEWAIETIKEWIDLVEFTKGVIEYFREIPETNNGNILAFLESSFRWFEVDVRQEAYER